MRSFASLLVFLVFCGSSLAQGQDNAPEKVFARANALLEKKQYADALALYRTILATEPDAAGPLQNGAMAAFFAGDFQTARTFYQKLKTADLNNGALRAKLVQVYQALGDDKARDTERTELIALHNSGKDTSSLATRKDFCRDQYRLGNRSVLVYEPFIFAPCTASGSFAVRYQFFVLDDKDQLETRIEVGWDFPEKDKKGVWQPAGAYYFDAYYPTGPWVRRTMGLAEKELPYAATKAHVQAILEGKVKPSGGTPRTEKS